MQSDTLKDRIQRRVREKIAISNIRRELEMSKKYINLLYVGIGMCAVVIIGVFIIFNNIQVDNNSEIAKNNEITNNIDNIQNVSLPVATEKVQLNSDFVSYEQINPKYILAIKVNKIKGYTNYCKKLNKYMSMPITIFEAEVLKCYKGNLEGNIDIWSMGGIITISDLEKSLTEQQREKRSYSKLTKEEKENTFVEVVTSLNLDIDKPEENKVYFVCLAEDNDMYDMLSVCGIYGIKEFNIQNETISLNGKETNIFDINEINELLNK